MRRGKKKNKGAIPEKTPSLPKSERRHKARDHGYSPFWRELVQKHPRNLGGTALNAIFDAAYTLFLLLLIIEVDSDWMVAVMDLVAKTIEGSQG